MPISTVYAIDPVFSTISAVPGTSGAAGAAQIADDAAGAEAGGPTAVLVFSKAVYADDAHGGPTAAYPASVTLIGSVVRKGLPAALLARADSEPRDLARIVFEITTGEDPGAAFGPGVKLATNDHVLWAGIDLLVLGTAIPSGSGWITAAVLVT
jgi:tripartite-type tricarboxylate transporter receptor subunit TctC